jgi:hypothetical protein
MLGIEQSEDFFARLAVAQCKGATRYFRRKGMQSEAKIFADSAHETESRLAEIQKQRAIQLFREEGIGL